MKIAYDAKRAAQNRTGLGNYSRFILSGLVEQYPQHEYQLYIPNPKKQSLLGNLADTPSCTLHHPKSSLWRQAPSLWRVWGQAADLKRATPHIYHGLSGELPVGIERISGMKTLVTMHDLIFLRYPQYYSPIDRLIYTHKFRSACRRADQIIAVSECTKRDLVHYFNADEQKIHVVYQGCDESFRRQATEDERQAAARLYNLPPRYLLYLGSIEERKNLAVAVRALSALDQSITIIAVGKHTAYADQVRALAEELGVGHRLTMLHNVAFRHLPALYQQADAFLYPSRYEGFGIPLLESLCSGTPVIAATGSCLEEAGGAHSIYLSPDDPHGWAQAISQVWDNASLRHEMTVQGTQHAARFLPHLLSERLMAHYTNAIR